MAKSTKEITQWLKEYSAGNESALNKLWPEVYAELHRQADRYMRGEKPGQTLQPTALVNEAFLRLCQAKSIDWQNRNHFFAMAATMMRRIIVDHAKAKRADKRGGKGVRVSFDEKFHSAERESPDLIALDEALKKLEAMDPRMSRVVELRYFGGLSIEETAHCLELSPASIKRDWNSAKLWLFRELSKKENTHF